MVVEGLLTDAVWHCMLYLGWCMCGCWYSVCIGVGGEGLGLVLFFTVLFAVWKIFLWCITKQSQNFTLFTSIF